VRCFSKVLCDFKDLSDWPNGVSSEGKPGGQRAGPERLWESIFPSSMCIRTGANEATKSL
jgi:hypothetical protein